MWYTRTFATLTLAFCIAGCGGGSPETPSSPASTGSAPPTSPAGSPATAAQPRTPAALPPAPKPAEPVTPPSAPKVEIVENPTAEVFVVASAPAFEMVDDPERNRTALGPSDVDPNAFVQVDSNGERTASAPITQEVPNAEPLVNTRASDDGFPLEVRSTVDGAEMVYVPPGQFQQGRDNGPANEQPQHTAFLSGFYIDVHEVTVAEYQRYIDAAKAAGERPGSATNLNADPSFPVLGVSYRDAQAYADWANKLLPTEAQWEKAARGTVSLPNVWGRGRPLWSRHREPGKIDKVGAFPNDRSVYGVFDLAGNAREWCRDFWDDESYAEAAKEPGGIARDWTGPTRPRNRSLRAVRGTTDSWSVTAREGISGSATDPTIGFRCVLELPVQN